jgi:hypothetical protein
MRGWRGLSYHLRRTGAEKGFLYGVKERRSGWGRGLLRRFLVAMKWSEENDFNVSSMGKRIAKDSSRDNIRNISTNIFYRPLCAYVYIYIYKLFLLQQYIYPYPKETFCSCNISSRTHQLKKEHVVESICGLQITRLPFPAARVLRIRDVTVLRIFATFRTIGVVVILGVRWISSKRLYWLVG